MIVLENVSVLAKRYHIPEEEIKRIFDLNKVLIHRIGRSIDNLMVKIPDAEDALVKHAAMICGPEYYIRSVGYEHIDLEEYKQSLRLLDGISKTVIKHSLLSSIGKALGDYECELWLTSGGPLFYFYRNEEGFVVSDLFALISRLPDDIKEYIKNILEKEVGQLFTLMRRPIVVLNDDSIIVRYFRETTIRERWFVKDLVYNIMYDYLNTGIKSEFKNDTIIEE